MEPARSVSLCLFLCSHVCKLSATRSVHPPESGLNKCNQQQQDATLASFVRNKTERAFLRTDRTRRAASGRLPEYACTHALHGAPFRESNIPAIIRHAEQARRHNAIRPRCKGARECSGGRGSESERREYSREWQTRKTRVSL